MSEGMGALSILRFGWAGYEMTTEGGTRIVVDPYLHGSEGGLSGLPESPFTVDDLAEAADAAGYAGSHPSDSGVKIEPVFDRTHRQ
jgi:hypothetical protein